MLKQNPTKNVMERQSNNLICFNETVANSVLYKSNYYRGTNPYCIDQTHLFEMDGKFFEYFYHASYSGSCESLIEISKDDFDRKVKALKAGDWEWNEDRNIGRADNGATAFSLTISESATFNKSIAPRNIKTTHPQIVAIMDEIASAIAEAARQQREKEAKERKDYARNCGKVAKRLGISFVNVLRLGYKDEEQLKEFQASLLAAKKQLAAMSEEDRDYYDHEIFGCGRARMAAALHSLGVQTFGRDVRYMDFSELSR